MLRPSGFMFFRRLRHGGSCCFSLIHTARDYRVLTNLTHLKKFHIHVEMQFERLENLVANVDAASCFLVLQLAFIKTLRLLKFR